MLTHRKDWNLLVIINGTKHLRAFTLVWLPRVARNEICLPRAGVSPRWNNESGSNEISMRLKSCQLLFPSFIPAIPRFPFIPSTFPFSRHSRETLLVRISHSTFWKETVPVAATASKSSSGNVPPDNSARDTACSHFPSNYQCLGGTKKRGKRKTGDVADIPICS